MIQLVSFTFSSTLPVEKLIHIIWWRMALQYCINENCSAAFLSVHSFSQAMRRSNLIIDFTCVLPFNKTQTGFLYFTSFQPQHPENCCTSFGFASHVSYNYHHSRDPPQPEYVHQVHTLVSQTPGLHIHPQYHPTNYSQVANTNLWNLSLGLSKDV